MSYWSNSKRAYSHIYWAVRFLSNASFLRRRVFKADFSSSFCAVAFSAFKEKDKHIKFLCFEDQTNSMEAYK